MMTPQPHPSATDPTTRLRLSVQNQTVPDSLHQRIRLRLDEPAKSRLPLSLRAATIGGLAACASVAAISAWRTPARQIVASSSIDRDEARIAALTALLPAAYRPGLEDHLHCSVLRPKPSAPASLADASRDLPNPYRDLLDGVLAHLPHRYSLYSAHVCRHGHRDFVHFQFADGPRLLSVIVTRRRADEAFADQATGLAPAAGFTVAATASGQYLAYLVSDLDPDSSATLMSHLSQPLHQALRRLPA